MNKVTIKNVKIGKKVYDKWYPDYYGIGKITKILKTRISIKFLNGCVRRYDKAHLQFLEYAEGQD